MKLLSTFIPMLCLAPVAVYVSNAYYREVEIRELRAEIQVLAKELEGEKPRIEQERKELEEKVRRVEGLP